ncbi:MAG: alkaline phosphatase family protein, partial [Gammaproteobacteria bacterium]|nr:alkaline phosphatase family protein [Gammaproteobacteria bacterium]
MPIPDYTGNSLVNLMSSIYTGLSGKPHPYPECAALSASVTAQYRNVILFVIDGLGYDYLFNQGAGSLLHQHCHSPLTSVFPSTTASAITTFMTGQAPLQHALTGWFTWLRELGCVTAVLPLRTRTGGNNFDSTKINVAKLYGHTPIFDQLEQPTYVVAPEWIIHSEYNITHSGSAILSGFDSLDQCRTGITRIIKANDQRKYVYAYWPDFDRYSHEFGNDSQRVADHFADLDEMFEQLVLELQGTDTLLLVTADHGFIDTVPERVIHLQDHPVLQETLVLPLCGEPRTAYCYVHPDKQQQFLDYVRSELAYCADLKSAAEMLAENYYGMGEPHPELIHRIGHFVLHMKENYVIKDRLPGETPFVQIGVHGGSSRQEMLVPLV